MFDDVKSEDERLRAVLQVWPYLTPAERACVMVRMFGITKDEIEQALRLARALGLLGTRPKPGDCRGR